MYEFYVSTTDYGQTIEATFDYISHSFLCNGACLARSSMRMYPFNTMVASTQSPFRVAFKMSNAPPLLPDSLDFSLGDSIIIRDVDVFPSSVGGSFFECFFKEYANSP